MATVENRVKEVIQFYVRTNYDAYLKNNKIQIIPSEEIETVVRNLYIERRDHLKGFVKTSLRELMKDDYPGDLVILNILVSVFEDDDYCINRLVKEIKLYQQGVTGQRYDHS